MLNVISWNVRGLNAKIKQSLVFGQLKRAKAWVIFLQEMHILG